MFDLSLRVPNCHPLISGAPLIKRGCAISQKEWSQKCGGILNIPKLQLLFSFSGLRPVGGGEVGRLLLQPDGLRLLPQRGRQVRRPHRRGRTGTQFNRQFLAWKKLLESWLVCGYKYTKLHVLCLLGVVLRLILIPTWFLTWFLTWYQAYQVQVRFSTIRLQTWYQVITWY